MSDEDSDNDFYGFAEMDVDDTRCGKHGLIFEPFKRSFSKPTSLNHSKGPFQNRHLFKKDDLIMSQVEVGPGQFIPYRINPVKQKIVLSYDLTHFPPKN